MKKGLVVLFAVLALFAFFTGCVSADFDESEIAGVLESMDEETAGLVVKEDFEGASIGDSIPMLGWNPNTAVIAQDPMNPGNKVVKVTPANYNDGIVIALTLPEGAKLGSYQALYFRGFFAEGDVAYKLIPVYAYESLEDLVGPFGDSTSGGVPLGSYNRHEGPATDWEEFTVDFTSLPRARNFEGTVYFAFGINCEGTEQGRNTVWYADDVILLPK